MIKWEAKTAEWIVHCVWIICQALSTQQQTMSYIRKELCNLWVHNLVQEWQYDQCYMKAAVSWCFEDTPIAKLKHDISLRQCKVSMGKKGREPTQWDDSSGKALVTKPEDQRSISKTHLLEGENRFPQVNIWPLCTYHGKGVTPGKNQQPLYSECYK